MTGNVKYDNLLVIDSSGSTLRIGVGAGDALVEQTSGDRFRHAEFVFNLIEKALKEGGLRRGDLNGIAISTGPGSFTGLRVGLAAAKGLALALDIPIVGIPTFEAIAGPLFEKCGRALILVPSRRGEYYMYESSGEPYDENKISVKKSPEITDLAYDAPLFLIDTEINDPSLRGLPRIEADAFEISTRLYMNAAREKFGISGGDDIDRLVPLYIQTFPVKPRK